jgi:hypothetical protein
MIVHHFNNPEDYTEGGYFADDVGSALGTWIWDGEAKILSVRCPPHERSIDLSQFNLHRMDPDKLKDRLVQIAQEVCEGFAASLQDLGN